jgi:hypothetical protein
MTPPLTLTPLSNDSMKKLLLLLGLINLYSDSAAQFKMLFSADKMSRTKGTVDAYWYDSNFIYPCPTDSQYLILSERGVLIEKTTGQILGPGNADLGTPASLSGYRSEVYRTEAVNTASSFQSESARFPFIIWIDSSNKKSLRMRRVVKVPGNEFLQNAPFIPDSQLDYKRGDYGRVNYKDEETYRLYGKPRDYGVRYVTGTEQRYVCPPNIAPCTEYVAEIVNEPIDLYSYQMGDLKMSYIGKNQVYRDIIEIADESWPILSGDTHKLSSSIKILGRFEVVKCDKVCLNVGTKHFVSISRSNLAIDSVRKQLLDIDALLVANVNPENLIRAHKGGQVDVSTGYSWDLKGVHYLSWPKTPWKSFIRSKYNGGNILVRIELSTNFTRHDTRFNHPISLSTKETLAIILDSDLKYVTHKRVIIGDDIIITPEGGFATLFRKGVRLIGYDSDLRVIYDNVLAQPDPMNNNQTETVTNLMMSKEGDLTLAGVSYVQKNYGKPNPILWKVNCRNGEILETFIPNCQGGWCNFEFKGLGRSGNNLLKSYGSKGFVHFDEHFGWFARE